MPGEDNRIRAFSDRVCDRAPHRLNRILKIKSTGKLRPEPKRHARRCDSNNRDPDSVDFLQQIRPDLGELVLRICELACVPAPLLPASARLAAWALVWAEAAWAVAGRTSPLPALPLLLLCEGYPMGPGAAQRELGLLPRPLDRTLADAIAWYRGRRAG